MRIRITVIRIRNPDVLYILHTMYNTFFAQIFFALANSIACHFFGFFTSLGTVLPFQSTLIILI